MNIMDYVISFLVGGFICFLAQILIIRTKITTARILVLFLIIGMVLEVFNIYAPFKEFAKAGASVPLLGFGNVLFQGVKEAVDMEGFLGVFLGGFKAGAAGISGALIFGYIASLLTNPKMKK